MHFWKELEYWPHFKYPRTFSEKIWRRMLYDRDPQLPVLADKLRVRDYVRARIGEEYIIPLLWVGTDPALIPYATLPDKFVIKTTHGSGFNIIVSDLRSLDKEWVRRRLQEWLRFNYCTDRWLGIEWFYKSIEPYIIVETLLEENGKCPVDYKLFCFSGRAEFIQSDFDRFEHHTRKICDRDFNPLDAALGCEQYLGKVVRPVNFEQMVRVAESLAAGLDFMRVDLYNVDGRIYFGELTGYPGAGTERFVPRKYDFLFGEKWKMR